MTWDDHVTFKLDPNEILVMGPPPNRDDYATEEEFIEAWARRCGRIVNVEAPAASGEAQPVDA